MNAGTSMEKTPELVSNKRKRSSSSNHPFMGIFTRSKSHIYLHCNRSGLARSDSYRHSKNPANLRSTTVGFLSQTQFQSHNKKPRRKSETMLTQDSADVDDLSGMIIKDLRSRRIFSLASTANECGLYFDDEEKKGSEKGSGGLEEEFSYASKNLEAVKCDSSIDKEYLNCSYFDTVKQGEDKAIMKSNAGYTHKEQSSTNLPVTQGNLTTAEDGEISNEVSDLDEECMQATPPDAEILYRHNVSSKLLAENLQNRECLQDNISKKSGKSSGSKSVLNPSSRVKVFRAPGSFSYRRLLPYLMDMVQDNSCALRNSKSIDEYKTASPSGEVQAGDSLLRSVPIVADGLSDGSVSNLISIKHLTDSSMLFGSQKDPCMRVYSPTSLIDKYCSKPPTEEVNEKIKICASRKDKNLEGPNPENCPRVGNPRVNGHSNDTKPQYTGENRANVSKSPCYDQDDAGDTKNGLCLMAEKYQLRQGDSVGQSCSNMIQSESLLEIKTFGTSHASKTIYPNQTISIVSNAEENSCTSKKGGDDNDVLDTINHPTEKSIQETPPDADIIGKPVVYQGANNRIEFVSQGAEVLMKPLNESTCRNNCYSGGKRMDSSTKSKLGLNPSSRLKLFKTRDSFGYRRLLPYLMDIAKNNSGDSGNVYCPKLEKRSEENQSSQLPMSELHETPAKKLNNRSHGMERDTDSCTLEMTILPTTKNGSGSDNLMSSEHNSETPVSNGSQDEQEADVVEMISNHQDGHSKEVPAIVRVAHGSSSVTIPQCSSFASPSTFSTDDLNLVSHELSADNDESCRKSLIKLTNNAKPGVTVSFSQNSSKVEVFDPLGSCAHDSRKGILKRIPRGCRGACMCLKCASFRLHAERAFEFSKNQMQDVEEVAIDLIKELSNLRNMLEIAAFGPNDNHVVCINQVKKACREASEAEELAKSRLSQMNYDLTVHCRIPSVQRPRVRFSNNVEERIISLVNSEQNSK